MLWLLVAYQQWTVQAFCMRSARAYELVWGLIPVTGPTQPATYALLCIVSHVQPLGT